MAAIRQQTLPLPSETMPASPRTTLGPVPQCDPARGAPTAADDGSVRWGAAVVDRTRVAESSWAQLDTRTHRGRRKTVWVDRGSVSRSRSGAAGGPSSGGWPLQGRGAERSVEATGRAADGARVGGARGSTAGPVLVGPLVAPVHREGCSPVGGLRVGVTPRDTFLEALAPRAVPATGGSAFTRSRIRYAFELFGACMLIVTFLALAMFA